MMRCPHHPYTALFASTQSCPEQKAKDFGAWAWTLVCVVDVHGKADFSQMQMGVQPSWLS